MPSPPPNRDSGQTSANTLPTIRSVSTYGFLVHSVSPSRHMCTVESAEWARLSPITNTVPSGTGPTLQLQLPVIGPKQSCWSISPGRV